MISRVQDSEGIQSITAQHLKNILQTSYHRDGLMENTPTGNVNDIENEFKPL
jgi:hypothetical protein